MSSFKRLADAGDLTGKTALVRVDFNVPFVKGSSPPQIAQVFGGRARVANWSAPLA